MLHVNFFPNVLPIYCSKKYALNSSYMSRILHLEGGEFCGSTKQKVDMPLKSIWDSQMFDDVNFSHLEMETIGTHSTP
jgi:hypothetical protein